MRHRKGTNSEVKSPTRAYGRPKARGEVKGDTQPGLVEGKAIYQAHRRR